jgi:hypothetical protein
VLSALSKQSSKSGQDVVACSCGDIEPPSVFMPSGDDRRVAMLSRAPESFLDECARVESPVEMPRKVGNSGRRAVRGPGRR